MSSTLAAWRRAGGGLRSPLSQDDAQRIARQLGAGVLCQGSIVGVGSRLTITATLLDASSGQPTPFHVQGSSSRVFELVEQLAAQMAAARRGRSAAIATVAVRFVPPLAH